MKNVSGHLIWMHILWRTRGNMIDLWCNYKEKKDKNKIKCWIIVTKYDMSKYDGCKQTIWINSRLSLKNCG